MNKTSLIIVNDDDKIKSVIVNDDEKIKNIDFNSQYTNSTKLIFKFSQLTTLPKLPHSLRELHFIGNSKLTTLPELPNSLTKLICIYNSSLTTLPKLPTSLTELEWSDNELRELPDLPISLTKLICDRNSNLISLPELPISLRLLQCTDNNLTELPDLPDSLRHLKCNNNKLTKLPDPPLPITLKYLNCNKNELTVLPKLPDSLIELNCSENKLKVLPDLPISLIYLNCEDNELTKLPDLHLHSSLTQLLFDNNPMTDFTLPRNIDDYYVPIKNDLILLGKKKTNYTKLENYDTNDIEMNDFMTGENILLSEYKKEPIEGTVIIFMDKKPYIVHRAQFENLNEFPNEDVFYTCKIRDKTVDKNKPLYSLRKMGLTDGLVTIEFINFIMNNPDIKYFGINPTFSNEESFVSEFYLLSNNRSNISTAHCQDGYQSKLYSDYFFITPTRKKNETKRKKYYFYMKIYIKIILYIIIALWKKNY